MGFDCISFRFLPFSLFYGPSPLRKPVKARVEAWQDFRSNNIKTSL